LRDSYFVLSTQKGLFMTRRRNATFILLFALITTVFAQADLTIKPVLDKSGYAPGDTIVAALECVIPEGHHLYGNPLGPGIGKPLEITLNDNKGIVWIKAFKIPPKKYQPPVEGWVWAYEKKAWFFIQGIIAASAGADIHDTLNFNALICRDACIPIDKNIALHIPVSNTKVVSGLFDGNKYLRDQFTKAQEMSFRRMNASSQTLSSPLSAISMPFHNDNKTVQPQSVTPVWDFKPVEKKVNFSIWLAIALAFIAGIILNAMPCVLPVLGIKVISIVKGNAGTKKRALEKSLIFSAGMMAVFLILASFAAFAQFSWGQQFQKPEFLIAIIGAIFIFGLGELGIFTMSLPVGNMSIKKGGNPHGWIYEDFFKGIMTTLLATPCSGPFLGATLAWTLTQQTLTIYIVFISLGLGMAFPYVLLSVWTGLQKWIPKPGKWMEDLEHVMAFLLFGFAIYLMTGLPQDLILSTIAILVCAAFAIMLYTRICPFGTSFKRKFITGIIILVLVSGGGYESFVQLHKLSPVVTKTSGQTLSAELWQEYTPQKLLDAQAAGRNVIIDFTANWCMNCQYNKMTVFLSKDMTELIKRKNILALSADLTSDNVEARGLLQSLGGRSIPFFAVFPADDPQSPVIMRDIVKKKDVLRTLSELQ
jgi:thiol:disulfide interchange protein